MKKMIMVLASASIMLLTYFSMADQLYSKQLKKQEITKVSDVLGLKEGSKVWMQGNIVRTIGEDHYILKDNTGEIKMKISKFLLRGMDISPNKTVIIYGKMDKNDYISRKRNIPPEIEVKKIEILKETDSQSDDGSLIRTDTNRK